MVAGKAGDGQALTLAPRPSVYTCCIFAPYRCLAAKLDIPDSSSSAGDGKDILKR